MAQDLTGQSLSEVYSTLLHTDTTILSSGPLPVYNGVGSKTSLSLSTSSAVVTGSFVLNNVVFPLATGPIFSVPVMTSANNLEYRTLNFILTSGQTIPVADGTYSSATITYANGLISAITNTGTTKTFFIASRDTNSAGPGNETLINSITWNTPSNGDIAFIFQKVMSGTTMVNLTIFKYVYSTSLGWTFQQTF